MAQVLLDVYNAIPDDYIELKTEYRLNIATWLEKDVIFTAPEIFPGIVWKEAQQRMGKLFGPYMQLEWNKKCADIFSDRLKK